MCGMTEDNEWFREITEYGVIPSPSGAGALLLHDEDSSNSALVLTVLRLTDRARKVALATFASCVQSVFGYPNDEAYCNDPRRVDVDDGPGYGFYEVMSSSWPARLTTYNQRSFPGSTVADDMRHFFVGSHDGSAEFLARDMTVEIFNHDFATVARMALDRILLQ
jgi:hypothetical protein